MPVIEQAVHEKKVNAWEDLCVHFYVRIQTCQTSGKKESSLLYIFDDIELVPIFYEELTSKPWGSKGQLSKHKLPAGKQNVSPVYCTNRKAVGGGVSVSIIHVLPSFSIVRDLFVSTCVITILVV